MAPRIKLVWPGSGPRARLPKFYVFSAVSHGALAAAFIFLPGLFGDSRPNFSDDFYDNAIFAELVGEPGEPATQATPAVEPEPEPSQPQPEPEPPPEESPAAGDVEFSKRAEPTPAKEDPEPAPPTDPAPDAGEASEAAGTGERIGDAGAGVSGGGEISLFGWYQSSVSRALYATWQRPLLAGLREPLAVKISFNIQKDGSVANLRVTESSGVSALDRSALRAVADAAPLPRLPPAWRGSGMTAAYLFEITPEDF